jgi:hypothetical protein
MKLVRSQRWRRRFVAACVPYLLLSVFVDFIHLHPQVGVQALEIASRSSGGVTAAEPQTHPPRVPEYPCAVCLWLQTGTSLEPSLPAGPAVIALANDLTTPPVAAPARPTLLSPDFRGPPLSLFA